MTGRKLQIISFILVIAGLALAILSWTDLCSFNGCSEAHEYRLFGFSLPLVGTLYFCILLFNHVTLNSIQDLCPAYAAYSCRRSRGRVDDDSPAEKCNTGVVSFMPRNSRHSISVMCHLDIRSYPRIQGD